MARCGKLENKKGKQNFSGGRKKMADNTNKNNGNVNDGLLMILAFIGMAFILFFMSFFIGREYGRNDKTDLEEDVEALKACISEMDSRWEGIESEMETMALTIEELQETIEKMQEETLAEDAAQDAEQDAEQDAQGGEENTEDPEDASGGTGAQ